jgi:hypothetical protein
MFYNPEKIREAMMNGMSVEDIMNEFTGAVEEAVIKAQEKEATENEKRAILRDKAEKLVDATMDYFSAVFPEDMVKELGLDRKIDEEELDELVDKLVEETKAINDIIPIVAKLIEASDLEDEDCCCGKCSGKCDGCSGESAKNEEVPNEVKFTIFPEVIDDFISKKEEKLKPVSNIDTNNPEDFMMKVLGTLFT